MAVRFPKIPDPVTEGLGNSLGRAPISGTIVNDEHFYSRIGLCQCTFDRIAEEIAAVINRNDDGNRWLHGSGVQSRWLSMRDGFVILRDLYPNFASVREFGDAGIVFEHNRFDQQIIAHRLLERTCDF